MTPDGAATPLARLLAMAFRDLIDGMHDRLEAQGWPNVRPAFGFVLLAARDSPTSVGAVAALLGTTKQAASKTVEAMVDAGYLHRLDLGDDRRVVPLALSASGHEVLRAVEEIYVDLEAEWDATLGDHGVDRLRDDLDRVLRARHSGALPPVRPSW